MAWYQFNMAGDPNAPPARECHTIHVLPDKTLLLFGGNNDRVRMADVHLLDSGE